MQTLNLTVALLLQKKLPVCDESDWCSSAENRAKLQHVCIVCWKVVLKSLQLNPSHFAAPSNNWKSIITLFNSLRISNLLFTFKCHFLIILLSSKGKLRWNLFQKGTKVKCTRESRYCSDSGGIWKLRGKSNVYLCLDFPWISVWPFSGWERMKTREKQFLARLAYRI